MTTTEDMRDPVCWICHEEGSQTFCPECFSGFHIGCAVTTKEDISRSAGSLNRMCHQCSKLERSRHRYTSSQKIKSISRDMLNSVFDTILLRGDVMKQPPEVMKTERQRGMFENVKNFFNFNMIESKIKSSKYECTEELLFDMRKIEHTMLTQFKENHGTEDIDRYIKQLGKYCQEIDLCPHCIYNHYLTSLGPASTCPWGHKLVAVFPPRKYALSFEFFDIFGPLNLPPSFPAKIIAYSQCHQYIYIRLFLPRKPWSLRVPIESVNHLSKYDLEKFHSQTFKTRNRTLRQEEEAALAKLEIHLKELKKEFGDLFSLFSQNRSWRSNEKLFINYGSNSSELSFGRLENSGPHLTNCAEHQRTTPKELTKDFASKKRTLEIDLTCSPKKSARENSEQDDDLETCPAYSSSQASQSEHFTKESSSRQPHLINKSTHIATSINCGLNDPTFSEVTFEAQNGPREQLLGENNIQIANKNQMLRIDRTSEGTSVDYSLSNRSGEDEPRVSLKVFSRSLSNAELNDSSLLINSPEKSNKSEIPDKKKSLQRADMNREAMSKNDECPIFFEDDVVGHLSPTLSDRDRFEIMESDEEIEFQTSSNHFECQIHEIAPERSTDEPDVIPDHSSFSETADCNEKRVEDSGNQKTQRGSFDALNDKSDILKKESLSDQMEQITELLKTEKTESVLDKTHLTLSRENNSQMPTETCLKCRLLAEELERIKKTLRKYQVNCEALLEYCSDLEKQL